MKDFILCLMALALAGFGIVSCENSDWNKANESEEARQLAAAAKPHVIREYDGCKVYAWADGGGAGTTHYFTRCSPADTVTTERHFPVSCGKNCKRDGIEVVVTQPMQGNAK